MSKEIEKAAAQSDFESESSRTSSEADHEYEVKSNTSIAESQSRESLQESADEKTKEENYAENFDGDQTENSSLTVENMKRYEEETGSLGVEELMSRVAEDGESELNKEAMYARHGNPKTTVVSYGQKLNGDEFVAVSIEMQTDESWLLQSHVPIQTVTPSARSPEHTNEEIILIKPTISASEYSTTEFADDSNDELISEHHMKVTKDSKSPASDFNTNENPVAEIHLDDNFTEDSMSETVSSVGAPFILQYKPESKSVKFDYDNIQEEQPDVVEWDTMEPDQHEYYQGLLEEAADERIKMMKGNKQSEMIDIEPHAAYGTQQERKVAKERAAERMKAREVERQKQTVPTNQTNFYAFARQLKTVNYSLSSEKCMEEGWTIRPVTPPPAEESVTELYVDESTTSMKSGKPHRQVFIEKYYDNGSLFLAVFADGSGNIWYPSGNLAISILSTEKPGKFIFMIHEDKESGESPGIQAIFQPNGKCTCHYPSGDIKVNLTSIGGEFFNAAGVRVKKWQWGNTKTHVHAPPFQPIVCGLSRQVGIRITSQENILVTFSDARRSVRFNVGSRLRLKNTATQLEPINKDIMALQERATHIQSIIDRMNNLIRFSKSPRMEKLRLPKNLPSGPLCNPAKSQRLPPITPRSFKLKQSQSKIHKELKAHESLESLKDTVLPIVIVN